MNVRSEIERAKKSLKNNRKKTYILLALGFLFLSAILVVASTGRTTDIEKLPLSPYSTIKSDNGRTYFSLNSETESLYISDKKGIDAVNDFLKSDPKYSGNKKLLPENFTENSVLSRTSDSDKSIEKKEHFFFTQSINSVPVFGSYLIVHLKNDNAVYSVNGNLSSHSKVTQKKLSDDEAVQIAIEDAQNETDAKLVARSPQKYIFNQRIIDISNDSSNYISLGVYIDSDSEPLTYSTFYIVDLENGKVLYKEDQFKEALNRRVSNCNNTTTSCTVVRQEGAPPSGIPEADAMYDYFADSYNYFFQSFSRDSYNAAGGPFIGYVNYRFSSPNASWNGQSMQFGPGMVVKDVTWHELTHAVTQYTAGLIYQRQSGALNEGMSDIFGSASDNNWELGESHTTTLPRPLRYMNNPPLKGDPDKMSSERYWCSGSDNGGVHSNSGVVNKTFFLMTDGGSHNGCTISGVGRQTSSAIMYSVLTNYLSSSSNFYDFYAGIQQACGDLYGSTSDICKEVKKATQATELDQQPAGTQLGPRCSGSAILPATCIGQPTTSLPTATSTPVPGQATATPTLAPGQPTATPTTAGVPTATLTPTTRPPFQPLGTPTPTPNQIFRCVPDPKCVSTGKSIQLCPLVCTPQ